MHHVIGALLIGTFAGGIAGNRNRRRPIMRSVVKGGIVAKRKAQTLGATAVAEVRKLVDEARAELDQSGTELQD